jgi:uncharacterized SAM-binding protein YcdF (DUF218 family)
MIKRILKYIIIAIAALVVLDVGFVWGVAHTRPEIQHAQSVIVLGAAINTPALHNRTVRGLDLYEEGKADKLILSGGKIADADISEAEYMEKVVKKNAVGPVDYILEDQSHNTYENIRNSKNAILKAGGSTDSVIIVSDAFHLARAFLTAKRAGFKTVYWSSPSSEIYQTGELGFYYLREFVAMFSYLPRFIFG